MTGGERATSAAAVLLIGSIFVVDPDGLSPSGPTRFAAIAAVLGGWAAVVGIGQRLRRPTLAPARLPGPVWAAWVMLLVAIAGSVLAGADRWHGVFGTPERNLGLLTWVGFALAFFLGASLSDRAEAPLRVASAIGIAGLSGLALAERAGFDPTHTEWTGSRVGAPFAQATYVAVALVLLGPLTSAVALDSSRRGLQRWGAGALVAAGLVSLFLTGARGPLLGLGLALAVVLGLRGRRRVGAVAGAVSVAAVVVVSAIRGWSSLGGRLDEWRIGWAGVAERPLMGYGPEGYRGAFPGLVDDEYVLAYGADVITDRAHNVFLDVALSSGVVAAGLLAALWFQVGRGVYSVARRPEASPADLGLAVAVVAGFVQQLVLFPLAELDPILWLLAGVLLSRAVGIGGERRDRPPSAVVGVLVVVGVVTMAASCWWNATSAVAEHRFVRATSFRQATNEQLVDQALAIRPESVRLGYAAAVVHANGPTLTDLDEALDILERALEVHPGDPALRNEYVFRLVERARRSGLDDDTDRAVAASTDAVSDAPNSPQLLGANAEALLLAGRLDDARHQVDRALALDPDDPALRSLAETIEKS